MFWILFFSSVAFLVGYFSSEEGGFLNMFDFDEGWIKKQNERFKKVFDLFFK
ncbi:hypothetical protein [Companilactobacillus baiquanensis]|uniref:Uncharacterized protein n=1 Tax=Companilactobacillus baiquanensis TaxID=2486005 RepID=A0ABW1UZ17_9LACO|nr:hypothetical protein [Companilactobacillus baiquanensis]